MNYLEGIHWIHHSSFLIESSGKVIYIDPYKLNESKPADFIFITHEHPDHCSLADIKKISKNNTLIICPKQCAKILHDLNLKVVKPGDDFIIGEIKCEVVPAYNRTKFFHQKKDNKAGYIIEINDVRIYHAGDTDFIPEMKNINNITVALVPISGLFTMSPKEAADAVMTIKPKVAVPIHYGSFTGLLKLFLTNDGNEFKKLAENNGVDVVLMRQEQ